MFLYTDKHDFPSLSVEYRIKFFLQGNNKKTFFPYIFNKLICLILLLHLWDLCFYMGNTTLKTNL